MNQRLIVEGKDGFVISSIMGKRKIPFPKGYNKNNINNFFINAGGISKVKTALKEELESPDITNIGVIVDSDDEDATTKFESLKLVIEQTLKITFPDDANFSNNGFGYQLLENLFIGIWVMPDNQSNGYLEHFVGDLIPTDNQTWNFVNEKVDELMNANFCEFTTVKKQKALIHTYLGLKESPGLPIGLGISANYFDANLPAADGLVEWVKNTFQLNEE